MLTTTNLTMQGLNAYQVKKIQTIELVFIDDVTCDVVPISMRSHHSNMIGSLRTHHALKTPATLHMPCSEP